MHFRLPRALATFASSLQARAGILGRYHSSFARIDRYSMALNPPPTVRRLPLPPEGLARQYREGVPVPFTQSQSEQLETFARSLKIDKSQFALVLAKSAIRVPARKVESVLRAKALAQHVYFPPRFPAVWPDPQSDKTSRLVVLKYETIDDVPEDVREYVHSLGLSLTMASRDLGYDFFTTDDVLTSVLPEAVAADGTPGAFASTGHIAHMNLRDIWVPYKYIIGQVIVDKNKGIETVVNKLEAIDTRFRTFAMELLAGKPVYEVTLNEHGCTFTFDFRHVYWNSRLESEHARLVRLFGPGAVVVDAMAGVGPFAIPAARVNKCEVWANDLNNASYAALAANAETNHVAHRVHASCEDAYTYIPRAVQQIWSIAPEGVIVASQEAVRQAQTKSRQIGQKRREKALAQGLPKAPIPTPEEEAQNPIAQLPHGRPRRLPEHFVMNLPSTALEFLGAFRGAYRSLASNASQRASLDAEILARAEDPCANGLPWPLVHVHCFTKDMEHPAEDLIGRANKALGISPESEFALRVPDEIKTVPNKPHTTPLLSSQPTTSTSETLRSPPRWNPLHPGRPKASLTYVRTVSPNKDMYCLTFPLGPHTLLDSEPSLCATQHSSVTPDDLKLDTSSMPKPKQRKPNDIPVREPGSFVPAVWAFWEPAQAQ